MKRLARRGLPDCAPAARVEDFAPLVELAREERLPTQMTVWWWGAGNGCAIDYVRANDVVLTAYDGTGEYRKSSQETRVWALRCVLRALGKYVAAMTPPEPDKREER